MTKNYLSIIFILFLFSFFLRPVYAVDHFRTDYYVDYFLSEKDNNLSSRVSFQVKITNQTPDLVIKNFSISFPKTFQIGNIKANDDFSTIIPQVTNDAQAYKISVDLSNPVAGMNAQNNMYLDFLQQNLFKVNGNVWEVILPTVDNRGGQGDYIIKVHLPPNSSKKISIAKPKPDHITLGEITWTNPTNKTIYAVFGSQQNYNLQLRYHLNNPELTRVYTDVAFPPDTLYQKLYVNSIQPAPTEVFTDEDGNYLGRYYLNPREDKTIYFSGGVSVYANPREEMRTTVNNLFEAEKKYLLAPAKQWNLTDAQITPGLQTPSDIYHYVTNTLTYNYGRLNSTITRLGASDALKYPDQAVCTEYSDVFIALARNKGIYSREMQGYGFSSDQQLRPLSVNSDVLHSWPEYYDTTIRQWVPVDPTWEDTSGIDYFTSFDLNHVIFAIHGKKSDYPYPAGSYKMKGEVKDVNITATSDVFSSPPSLSFSLSPLQIPVLNKDATSLKITVVNTGGTYIWNMPIQARAKGLTINTETGFIDSLAPYEKKDLTFDYTQDNPFSQLKTTLELSSDGKVLFARGITATSFYYTIGKNVFFVLVIVGGLFIAFKLIKR